MNNTNKDNKIISVIHLGVAFIIIILVIVFSFNIYATSVNESENQNITSNTKNTNNKESINNTEEVIQVILDESDDNEENSSEVKNEPTENSNIVSNQENLETKIDTAPNGEKYTVIATLNIPSLGIQYPILSSTSDALLKISVNKYWGANPNEVGNMVVLGHNYKDGRFFSKLLNIQKGAVVEITDLSGRTLEYKVYDTSVIDPDNNDCTSQLTNGETEITLITCFYEKGNVHATKRFVVKARA